MPKQLTVAFVLVSYGKNEPAGMERSVASLCIGLEALGHRSLVVAAGPERADDSTGIRRLKSLQLSFPATDLQLVDKLEAASRLNQEIEEICQAESIDVLVSVDCLWGLGAYIDRVNEISLVQMIHVLGDQKRLISCLSKKPDLVLVPSRFVIEEASAQGLPTETWQVLENSLMAAPAPVSSREKVEAFSIGSVRSVCRLGSEKGPLEAIASYSLNRGYDVVLAKAGFEPTEGSQDELYRACLSQARERVNVLPRLEWSEVTQFLKHACITVVPSKAETFGLVALESLSVGTPVVAFDTGNLKNLIHDAGICVPTGDGFEGIWSRAQGLLSDKDEYLGMVNNALEVSKSYAPETVAKKLLTMID